MVMFMLFFIVVTLPVALLMIFSYWKIFTKAGEPGWYALIPVFNMIIVFKIAGINPLWVLLYLAAFIPFVGGFASLGITIYLSIKLAQSFGREAGTMIGLILLPIVFYPILAFGSAEYVGPKFEGTQTIV